MLIEWFQKLFAACIWKIVPLRSSLVDSSMNTSEFLGEHPQLLQHPPDPIPQEGAQGCSRRAFSPNALQG